MGLLDFFKKNKYKKFKKELLHDSKDLLFGFETSKKRLNDICKKDSNNAYKYNKIIFNVYKDIYTEEVIPYAEEVLKKEIDISFVNVLAARYRKLGKEEKAKKLLLGLTGKSYHVNEFNLNVFNKIIENSKNIQEIKQNIKQLLYDFPQEENKILSYTFSKLKDTEYNNLAIEYGLKYFLENPTDKNFYLVFLKRLKNKEFQSTYELVKKTLNDIKYINKVINRDNIIGREYISSLYKKDLKIVASKVSEYAIKFYISQILDIFPKSRIQILKDSFSILKTTNEQLALEYLRMLEKINEKVKYSDKFKKNISKNLDLINESKVLKQWKFENKSFLQELENFSIEFEEKQIKIYIDKVSSKFKKDIINKISFSVLKDKHTELAVEYGMKYFEKYSDDIKFIKPLLKRLERLKKDDLVVEIAKKALNYVDDSDLKYMVIKNELNETIEDLFTNNKDFVLNNFEQYSKKLEDLYKDNLFYLYRILYQKFSDISYEKATYYANKALEIEYNEYVIKDLYDLHITYGSLYKAREVIPNGIKMPTLITKIKNIESLLSLYEKGFNLNFTDYRENYEPIKNKVFYLLHNRLPYNSGGYATRSHGLLTGVYKYKWNMHGVSRLGYPCDKIPDKKYNFLDIIDEIPYHPLINGEIGLGKLPLKDYLIAYTKELLELAKIEKPVIIHAASNFMNGVVGNYVAKCLGIKSVYEVRGLWEITRISRQPEWKDTEYYNLMVKMEAEAAKGADIVFTLTEALKDEMIARGVDGSKIIILPNGVTSERFSPLSKNKVLEKSLDLENKIVIGYIGSVVAYEGLEYLVLAVKLMVQKGITNISVLIVGDGAVLDFIKDEVAKADLSQYFIFTGRVPHEEVEDYYSLVDITPFPRKGQPVCEMVSPLKPFEAMAMEKAVLSSNVNALKEIVKDGFNGLLFEKDNVEDLANKLEILVNDNELRKRLGENARKWTIENRDWKVISNILNEQYHALIKGN